MMEKARQRMIAGINQISGRTDCHEAVALQRRSPAKLAAGILVLIVVMILVRLSIDPGAAVSGGIGGLLAATAIIVATDFYWLGYCEGRVLLVEVNPLQNKPVAVVSEHPYPAPASIDSGLLSKKVTLAGTTYLLPRQLEDRFRTTTGIN